MVKLKRLAILLPLFLLASLLLSAPAMALPTSQVWESYTAGDDSAYEVYGNIWFAQTFTVGAEAHSITEVRFVAYRELLPGTVTVSLRNTSAGLPVGADLTSGTTEGDNFTTDTGGVWYGVDLTEYDLTADTEYAIVIRAVAGDATNSLHLRYDGSTATFDDGSEINSTNGGVTWAEDTDDDLLLEVWGNPLLEVTGAQVFRGYLEDDDMLVVIHYFNTYVPYYPTMDSASYFVVQLRNATGATVLAQTTCRAWGYKPASIYLSADSAAGLTSGSAYRIYIYGNFTGNPAYYYTLDASDWRGEDLTFLDIWVLNTARAIGDYYSVDMTTFLAGDSGAEVLSTEGGIIFSIGIPGLNHIRPDLFEMAGRVEGYDPEDWTNAYTTATTWDVQVGTTAATDLTAIGTLFGVDGKSVGVFFLLAVYLSIAIAVVARGGDATIAIILAAPFILLGAWLRMIDIVIIAVTSSVAVLLLIFRFWWSRT